MAHLPAHYLSKQGGRWRSVKLLDVATLLLNVHMAAKDDEVGFEDANETLTSFTSKMSRSVALDPTLIESALWAANLLDEKGKFVSPSGETFEAFVKRLLGSDSFHRIYNTIERK